MTKGRRESFWGYLVLLLAKTSLSTSVFIVKYYGVGLLVTSFSVAFFGGACLAIYNIFRHVKASFPARLRYLNIARFVIRDLGLLGVWFSYVHGSIPRASALYFSGALFLVVFNRLFFKEPVPRWRVGLLLGAFAGMLIMVQPWHATQSIYIDCLVIASSFCIALSNCFVKHLLNEGMDIASSLKDSAFFRIFLSCGAYCWFSTQVHENIMQFEGRYGFLWGLLFLVVIMQNSALILHMIGMKKGRLLHVPFMDVWRLGYEWCMGFFIFNQTIKGSAAVGAIVIFLVVFMTAFWEWRQHRSQSKKSLAAE